MRIPSKYVASKEYAHRYLKLVSLIEWVEGDYVNDDSLFNQIRVTRGFQRQSEQIFEGLLEDLMAEGRLVRIGDAEAFKHLGTTKPAFFIPRPFVPHRAFGMELSSPVVKTIHRGMHGYFLFGDVGIKAQYRRSGFCPYSFIFRRFLGHYDSVDINSAIAVLTRYKLITPLLPDDARKRFGRTELLYYMDEYAIYVDRQSA